jgi:hypothetical protein
MTITDIDRISAVQSKLYEVKAWVDETLKILNYVRIDKEHEVFTTTSSSKAPDLYPGQYREDTISAEIEGDEECLS